MEHDRIRLRLHWGGRFGSGNSENSYIGGEVFNESVPLTYKYADLCLKLNEKVGYTTSIKYQAPGEELSPNTLVSIAGDDDLQELYDEYFQALRRPGTPVKVFRVKIFLFAALQDELDTEARPQQEPQQVFDPEEWCCSDEDEEVQACYAEVPSASTEPSGVPSTMQWQPQSNIAHAALDEYDIRQHDYAEYQVARQEHERELLPGFTPAFTSQPNEQPGLFGVPHGAENQLDRRAIGNLLQSISQSVIAQHPKGITEEIGLYDPYHEQDDCYHELTQAPPQQQQGQHQQQQQSQPHAADQQVLHVDPLNAVAMIDAADTNRYSSLFGNLPSHISIFGDVGRGGGRALSAGADDSVGLSPTHGAGVVERMNKLNNSHGLPSHLSIFGSSGHHHEDEDMVDVTRPDVAAAIDSDARHGSKCITQEFSRDASIVKPAPGLCLDECAEFGNGHALAMDPPAVPTPTLLDEVVKVPISEVNIIRKIGEGAFGEVSFANVQSHGQVAIKWLKKDRFAKYSESFMREAEVLAKLNHPNIIRMYGVVVEPVQRGFVGSTLMDNSGSSSGNSNSGGGRQQPDQPCMIAGIITDYVRGGSLSGQLRAAKRRPTLKERCQVAVQAARGMAFLHAQNPAVIHFDLKPDNLLVDGDGETLHVKVADFGLSKHKFQTFVSCRDLRGTLPYMAPELVSNPNQVSERCDVWSMGVVMWEMYTLEAPYRVMSAQQILMALMHGNIHLHVPSSCEPEWRGLIEMCMDPNPAARPSFKQLTTHLDALLRQLH